MVTLSQLRIFGISLSIAISFWLSFYLYFRDDALVLMSLLFYSLPALVLLFAVFKPDALRIIFKYWMLAVEALNKLLTWFTMSIVFFVIITPIALVRRVMGKSVVSSNKRLNSSKKISKQIAKEDMENPY